MNLFIGNIPPLSTYKDLELEFNKFGPCTLTHFVKIIQGKFAFVTYSNQFAGKKALIAWKGKKFAGTILNIEVRSETQGSERSESPRAVTPPCFLQHFLPVANKSSEQLESNTELSNEILNFHKVSECFSNTLECEVDPFKQTRRGRKKTGEVFRDPVKVVDEETIEAYGDFYKVEKFVKGNEGNCIVRCVVCGRIFKRKSIRSHAISDLHQVNRNR